MYTNTHTHTHTKTTIKQKQKTGKDNKYRLWTKVIAWSHNFLNMPFIENNQKTVTSIHVQVIENFVNYTYILLSIL